MADIRDYTLPFEIEVDSKAVQKLFYDPDRPSIDVLFQPSGKRSEGRKYRYHKAGRSEMEAILASDSIGREVNRRLVRGDWEYEEI